MDFTNFMLQAFKKRDRAAIMADILKSVTGTQRGRRKTNIMQSANLSSDLVNKYLDVLLRNGFMVSEGYMYKPTGKGLRFLQNLESDYLKLKFRV